MLKHLNKALILRIIDGTEPLDNTSIHPESYQATYQLLQQLNLDINELGTKGLKEKLSKLDVNSLSTKLNIGIPTLEDIIESLKAPQRSTRRVRNTTVKIRCTFNSRLIKRNEIKWNCEKCR